MIGKVEIAQDFTCPICLEVFYQPLKLHICKHIFCKTCIIQATQNTDQKKCPLCRAIFTQIDFLPASQLQQKIIQFYPQQVQQRRKLLQQRITYRVKVGNTTKILQTQSNNKYEWRLFLEPAPGQPPLHTYAERVQVYLHPTFHPNKIIYQAHQKIELKRIGWGTFRIDLKIVWKKKYGGYTDLFHQLNFSPKTQNILNCKMNN